MKNRWLGKAILLGVTFMSMVLPATNSWSQDRKQNQLRPDPVPGDRRPDARTIREPDVRYTPVPSASHIGTTGGTWTAQGPGPTMNAQVQNLSPNNEVAGAIHAVVAHPADEDILYVGAVNGGVWRTMNATAVSPTWTPLTDFEQSLSIGALEMDPGNPLVLLAGIGRFSSFGGDPPFQVAGGDLSGLLRTTDGGNTWTPITDPLLVGEHISSVASRGNILMAGANNFFGGGGVGGLFRSTDSGGTWTQISGAGTGLPVGAVDDLARDPANASRLYVALESNGVYRSDDTGANWTQVSNNDSTLNAAMLGSTNTRLAVAGDSRVFALVERDPGPGAGVVTYIGFSDDLGLNWIQMDVPGTVETALQGRDELMSLVVDPSNSDIVYVASISQAGTFDTNGDGVPDNPNSIGATDFHAHMFRGDVTRARGLTGRVSNQWDHLTHATGNPLMPLGGTASTSAPHADSREMTFDATDNLVEVQDGGINRRTSPGNNTGDWFSINGDIQVTELHSVAYDTNFDIIFGGTQDTGAVEQTATGSTTWNSMRPLGFQADGGKVAVDDSIAGTSVRYFSNQNLGLFRRRTCNPGCTDASPLLTGANPAQFYTPLELNTVNPTRLLLGTIGGLSESMDQGNTAAIVPGAGVLANSDARMVYGHPSNAELIYVGGGTAPPFPGNQVFVRTTAGGNLVATAAAFPGGPVFGIAVDPANQNILYVIGNTSVFQSPDGGASWTNITGDITADGAGTFRAVAYVPSATGDRIAVGTDAGVLISVEGSFGTWFRLGTGLPNAPVWDLDYDAADDVLVAGTLGRGAWTLADLSTLNVPPVAQCMDVTVPADPVVCSVTVSIDDGSFDPEGGSVALEQTPPPPYGLGMTDVTLVVTDSGGETDSCSATVTVFDETPPVITPGTDVEEECTSPAGAVVDFPTPPATDNCDAAPVVACVPPSGSTFPIGDTTVACRATDASSNFSDTSFTVSVVDTTPPSISSVTASPNVLWPPNHQMVPVRVDVSFSDLCDAAAVCEIISISSNERINGRGDGNTTPDWEITGALRANLRAERSGRDSGRVYTIGVRCTDAAGNRSTASTMVLVPHDRRRN